MECAFTSLVWREYEPYYEKSDLPVASLTTVKSVFKTIRMSFFSLKEDQCDLCVNYKVGNVSELYYTQHLQRTHTACEEKMYDIELCIQNNRIVVVLFADLQNVLLALNANVLLALNANVLLALNANVFYDKTNCVVKTRRSLLKLFNYKKSSYNEI